MQQTDELSFDKILHNSIRKEVSKNRQEGYKKILESLREIMST